MILYLTKLVKPTHPSPLRGSSSTPVSHTSPAPPTCTPARAPSSSPAAGPAPPPARPGPTAAARRRSRSEEHTSELQSQSNLVCRLLLEKKKPNSTTTEIGLAEKPTVRSMKMQIVG